MNIQVWGVGLQLCISCYFYMNNYKATFAPPCTSVLHTVLRKHGTTYGSWPVFSDLPTEEISRNSPSEKGHCLVVHTGYTSVLVCPLTCFWYTPLVSPTWASLWVFSRNSLGLFSTLKKSKNLHSEGKAWFARHPVVDTCFFFFCLE